MAWLTQEIADDLCTMIAIGFVVTDGGSTEFREEDYEAVQGNFKSVGIEKENLKISQSPAQATMPWIVAKTSRVPNSDAAQALTNDYWKYLQAITQSANRLE